MFHSLQIIVTCMQHSSRPSSKRSIIKEQDIDPFISSPLPSIHTPKLRSERSQLLSTCHKNAQPKQQMLCILCRLKQVAKAPFATCEHQVLCLECAQGYIDNALLRGQPAMCLIQKCGAVFGEQPNSMLNVMKDSTKNRWKVSQEKKKYPKGTEFKECMKTNCPGFLPPQQVQCFMCLTKHCNFCFKLHEGRCEMNQSTTSLRVSGMEFKNCTFCSATISKEGGCDQIQCLGCHRWLCYYCMKQWDGNNHHLCRPGGFFLVPFYALWERCCSQQAVAPVSSETIMEATPRRFARKGSD